MNKPAKLVPAKPLPCPDYHADGYGWAMAQAAIIRVGRIDSIDWENVAEEIESVGRSERSALRSQMVRILVHMLKWEAQSERRGKSWWVSIMNGRREALRILKDNPSLKSFRDQVHEEALEDARDQARVETGLPAQVFEKIQISLAETFTRAFERPESD